MSYPSEYNITNVNGGSKFTARTSLAARIATIISLIVALAVFQINEAKINVFVVYTYSDFRSYKCSFWVALIGLAYTVLQVPFAIHYMLRKKHLVNSYAFLNFDFYADKMVAFVLAMAAGTTFGGTIELENSDYSRWDDVDAAKIKAFLTVEYISAAFLLVASIACGVSSLHSSLALANKLAQQS